MMKSGIILVTLFVTVNGLKLPNPFDLFDSNDKPSTTEAPLGGFPFPTFLVNSGLSREEIQKWLAIAKDSDRLTKAETGQKYDEWAKNQNEDVQKKYEEWKKQLEEWLNKLIEIGDQTMANQPESVRELYEKIKKIRLDESISVIEECKQIRQAFKSANNDDVMNLLKAAPGIEGNCHGKLGGKENRRQGSNTNSNSDSASDSNSSDDDNNSTDKPNIFKRIFGF